MRFTKMHGAGNDYVYVEGFYQHLPDDLASLARRMSDRHFGVGGDGLIAIVPSSVADARMRMFNADGSESEMCGNGIRCVAKYLYDHGIVRKQELTIETGRGVLTLQLLLNSQGLVDRVRVDMGHPIFTPDRIPTTLPGSPPMDTPLVVDNHTFHVTCLSMGNPHCIIFTEELTDDLVLTWGPRIELHPAFPRRVNVEFVQIITPSQFRMRVWERGSGETLACGTGACAVCVAGVLTQRTARKVLAELRGGTLELEWPNDTASVLMTGPAEEVFEGIWPDEKTV